jgi:hypothetical protein
MIVPSVSNSITACDLLIAAACACALRAAESPRKKDIAKISLVSVLKVSKATDAIDARDLKAHLRTTHDFLPFVG